MGEIAGIIYHEPVKSERLLQDMLAPLLGATHPGPSIKHENFQVATCGDVIVGESAKKDLWLAMDGKITNADQLRDRLLVKGFPCETPEVSEVLLQAFGAWGPQFTERLEGEYAIVLLDKRRRNGYLVRDRLGRKPLYWSQVDHHFLFSTKLKSLLHSGLVSQSCARDGLAAYFFFGCCPQDFTPVHKVNKLLPGYYLDYDLDRSRAIKNYWSYSSFFTTEKRVTPTDLPEQIGEHITQHAQPWLEAERAVGCLLDGQLSSIVLAAQVGMRARGRKILYSSSAQVDQADIAPTVDRLTSDFGFEHCHVKSSLHSVILALPRIVWHLDEPIASLTTLPLWEIMSLAKQDHCTLMVPAGGRETLGGDPRYLPRPSQRSAATLVSGLPHSVLRSAVLPVVNLFSRSYAYEILRRHRYHALQGTHLRRLALFSEKECRFLSPSLARCFDADVFLHKFHHLNNLHDVQSALMYVDVKAYLPDMWLFLFERLLQPFGITWEAPFIDQDLVELLAQVPPEMKFGRKQEPILLHALIEKLLPGLNPRPINPQPRLISHVRETLEQIPAVLESLLDCWLQDAGIIAKKALKQLLFEAQSSNHGLQKAWAVLMLEIWFRLFIGRAVQPLAPEADLLAVLREKR